MSLEIRLLQSIIVRKTFSGNQDLSDNTPLKDFEHNMPLPLAIIDTMKNILTCFTRLYFRRMSTQPRGQGGSTLSH